MWANALRRPSFAARPAAGRPLVSRGLTRRTGTVGRLASSLPPLPGPGEALHLLMTGRYDLTAVLAAILARRGPCDRLRIATLSFSARNVAEASAWLDGGQVGALTVLCSEFFRDNNRPEWKTAVSELRAKRSARLAAARNHAKVVTLDWPDGCLVLEGSANLRTNSNQEQLTLVNDRTVCDWHGAWIDAMVDRHEREEEDGPGDAETGPAEGEAEASRGEETSRKARTGKGHRRRGHGPG